MKKQIIELKSEIENLKKQVAGQHEIIEELKHQKPFEIVADKPHNTLPNEITDNEVPKLELESKVIPPIKINNKINNKRRLSAI